MESVSGFLAIFGGVGAFLVVFYDLSYFTIPLMPLVVCYALVWPASVLYYLVSDVRPTLGNVIFPIPRIVPTLWRALIRGISRTGRSDHQP